MNVARPAGRALVAVSGGRDSTCLARLLAEQFPLELAWFDHGWRPSADDEAFVRGLAEELDAPLHVGRGRPDPAARKAGGPEADARAQRRRWLLSLAGPGDVVFLGHHRDDHVETIRMQLADGTPDPAGIPASHPPFERPLRDVDGAALQALATEQGWNWRDDPTNEASRRGALRAEPLPRTERDRLLALAAANEPRRRAAQAALVADRSLLQADGGDLLVDRAALSALDPDRRRRLLRDACSVPAGHRGPGRGPLDAVGAWPVGGGARRAPLGAGWWARTEGPWLRLARRSLPAEDPPPPAVPLGQPFGRWQLRARTLPAEAARRRFGVTPYEAVLSPAAGPLTVVPARSGDRLRPYGGGGSRLVRDLLMEAGVPRVARAAWPVVRDAAGRAVWLPGVRRGALHPLAPSESVATLLYTVAPFPSGGPKLREAR